jgi:hypothetical protein
MAEIVSARVIYRNEREMMYFGPDKEGGAEIIKPLGVIIKNVVL